MTSRPAARATALTRTASLAAQACLFATVAVLLWMTIGDWSVFGGDGGVNLVPFVGIIGELHNVNSLLSVVNVYGNVAVFVPVGALLVLGWDVRWWRATLAGAALSVGIEVVQHFVGRTSDIDDVILNTAGTALGAVVAAACLHVLRRRRRRGLRA